MCTCRWWRGITAARPVPDGRSGLGDSIHNAAVLTLTYTTAAGSTGYTEARGRLCLSLSGLP
jgi:hypothetical protein